MDIEIIVSTINNKFKYIDKSLQSYNNITIINQTPDKLNNEIRTKKINHVKWIDYDQKGLSRSRNLALEVAKSEYIYLTDDDVVLDSEFKQKIYKSFLDNPNADILAFQVTGIEKKYKQYSSNEININYLNSMKLSSVQLVLKADFIKKNELRYDELFGAGSIYKMGEENIFLSDALKKSAKIKYIPLEIGKVHLNESSWFVGFNSEYFFDRGAIYYRMFNKQIAVLLSIIFCLRKWKFYKNNINFLSAIKNMLEGVKDFENHFKKK